MFEQRETLYQYHQCMKTAQNVKLRTKVLWGFYFAFLSATSFQRLLKTKPVMMHFQRASERARACNNCFQAQMYLLIECQQSKRSFKTNLESPLCTLTPSDWLTHRCPADGPWDNSLLFTTVSTTHKSGNSGEGEPPYQKCTRQTTQELSKTSVVWAHKTTTCRHPPPPSWRKLLRSWYSRIICSYGPTEVLKVASSFYLWKVTASPYLLPIVKSAVLHSIHLLRTLTAIYRFYREISYKKSVVSKPLQ